MKGESELGRQLSSALLDALLWHDQGKPYFWRCKSMEKLVRLGLAKRWAEVGEPNGYELTEQGAAVARKQWLVRRFT